MAGKPHSIKFCLLHADHVVEGQGQQKAVVRLWGRSRDGKSVVVRDGSLMPYFYVQHAAGMSGADVNLLKSRILEMEVDGRRPVRAEETERKFLGKPVRLIKVYASLPADVPGFRDALKDWKEVEEEYEYGIPFYRRYMIDRGLIPMEWAEAEGVIVTDEKTKADIIIEAEAVRPAGGEAYPAFRILAFDIEMVREGDGEKIIMVSFADNAGFRKAIAAGTKKCRDVEPAGSEAELIRKFVETVSQNDPDIVVGYNTDRFDFPKMAEKAMLYRTPLAIGRDQSHFAFRRRGRVSAAQLTGRSHIDLYDFIENILSPSLSTEVLTLDRVAKELIGEGKETLGWTEIEKAWKDKDIGMIARYCMRDSYLTLKLAENLLPQIFEISKVSGQLPFDTARMSYSQLVEWLLIRKAFHAGELAPNRPKYGEVSARRRAAPYVGGYVHQPKEGIHESIAVFDFASLYPSITITHNVSPETLDCPDCKADERNNVPESEHYFCSKAKGFVPAIIEELVVKRNGIKDAMKSLSPKTFEYKALHNRQHAMKIIANASYGYYGYAGSRWYSRICAESITAWGRMYIRKVIDMAEQAGYEVVYGDTDSMFVKVRPSEVRKFLKRVNDSLTGVMEMEFKGMYESGIFVVGKTTGLAAKKRYALIDKDGNMTIRGFEKVRRDWSDIAKDTQEAVLKAILRDKSPEKAVRIVRRIVEDLKKGKVRREDLVIYTQLTKPVDQYEQASPHVTAASKMIEAGMPVHEGSTIAYIITKGTGSISERAEPAESAGDYDPEYYINNQVVPAAMRVLSGLGYREEDLLSKKRLEQVSLKDFVKK